MPETNPNAADPGEELDWIGSPFGDGVVAVARALKACVFCGHDLQIRVHRVPAHPGCWGTAGYPVPVAPDEAGTATPAPISAPEGAAAPGPAPQQTAAGEGFARRRGAAAGAAGGFEIDPAAELTDFHRELEKAARRGSRPAPSRDQAADALERWHAAVTLEGEPLRFVSNAGRTGIVGFQWMTARYGAMVMPARVETPQVWDITSSREVLRVLSFEDTTAPLEPGMRVVETDIHAQYAAAAHSVNLGDGEPTHVLGPEAAARLSDQKALVRCPGYVQLAAAPNLDGLPAHVRGAFAPAVSGWWLPMPLAAYLVRDHGVVLELSGAVFWHERLVDGRPQRAYGTRLARWAKLFISGREQLMLAEHAGDTAAGLAVGAVKATYSTFLGGLLRSTRHNDTETLRPDWNEQVVAQAGANMLRALDKALAVGSRPLGALKDATWWAVDTGAQAPDGLVISTAASERPFQPGKWHVDRRATADDRLVTAHRSGHAARFLKALIAADAERRAAEQKDDQ